MNRLPILLIALVLAVGGTSLHAQMLNPDIDRPDEPFCYYSKPTDVIGVMDGRMATLVSPEGYLYTGYAELMFFTGNPPVPVNQRVKTLQSGYLPINEYHFARDGIYYDFKLFAATLDGNPESALMNFIRVTIKNTSKEQRAAFFSAGTRYQNESTTGSRTGDNRFYRPATAKQPGGYEQAGEDFNPKWKYAFQYDAFTRDGKVLYIYSTTPKPERMMTLNTGYNDPPDTTARTLNLQPATPVGIVQYRLILSPGEEQALEFKMPYIPLPVGHPDLATLESARFGDLLGRTVSFWEYMFRRGIEITVPEEKAVNTFKANLVYDLIARNKVDSMYIQTVNDFHYHAFWLRDASYIVRMYDLSGYHDIAKQCLDFYPRWQQPDGNFVSQGGQFDGWGQTMWAYGQHYRLTKDKAFAEKVYPAMQKAVEWLKQARRGDSLGVMPKTSPGDNEDINGHVTGHNFWALAGLKNVILVAEGLGKEEEAEGYQKEYDDYLAALKHQLQAVTAKTNGYMPPGLEGPGGQDWGNMLSVYPEIILDPHDPMVTATLDATRKKYQEGIMTYGDGRWLHHYLTMKNTETELVRGDQEMALDEFYSMLVHTSATQAGFEFCILPWSTRDFGQNLTPHGWFGAKFRALFRNMMLREENRELHLFSCISPEWVRDGEHIQVKRAPTYFGQSNMDFAFGKETAELTLDNTFFDPPTAIVLHIPWFMRAKSAKADGQPVQVKDGKVTLPPTAKKVSIEWSRDSKTKAINYELAVKQYKEEYRKRYEKFLKTGE